MLQHSEQINDIAAALAKAQAEVKGATKDSENPHFRSRYADLASVREACFSALTKQGIAILQGPGTSEAGDVSVTTMIVHGSGQWFRNEFAAKPAKPDAQGIGSVITYLRRYGLSAMVGVAPEDDDGEAASGRGANGHSQVAGTAKPITKPAPAQVKEPAYKAWVRQAEGEIAALADPKACDAWVSKNNDALKKLSGLAHDEYEYLLQLVTKKQSALLAA